MVINMKNLSKKILNVIILMAKHNVKNDINSTGSPWSYQPKLPKKSEDFKKK